MGSLRRFGAFLYRWWMKFASLLAFINTRILLTLVYLLLIGPVSSIIRLMGKDYLDRSTEHSESFWKAKKPAAHSLEESKRQF